MRKHRTRTKPAPPVHTCGLSLSAARRRQHEERLCPHGAGQPRAVGAAPAGRGIRSPRGAPGARRCRCRRRGGVGGVPPGRAAVNYSPLTPEPRRRTGGGPPAVFFPLLSPLGRGASAGPNAGCGGGRPQRSARGGLGASGRCGGRRKRLFRSVLRPGGAPSASQSFVWMGRKRMEEQWWKGELAADIHQTLRTKVCSRFVPFPQLCSLLCPPQEKGCAAVTALCLQRGCRALLRSKLVQSEP